MQKSTPRTTMSMASLRSTKRPVKDMMNPAAPPRSTDRPISITGSNSIFLPPRSRPRATWAITPATEKNMIVSASSRAMTPRSMLVNSPLAPDSETTASTAPGAVAAEIAPTTRAADTPIAMPAKLPSAKPGKSLRITSSPMPVTRKAPAA